ncbi:MAG: 4a-hydroxytetrahydrobiopterin dehydratase [Acidobacteria bacterium]|nr:MAG: 4a-hydroxytetrahydrobiopterin dehydratase [Acidobacteriota bacterium]
MSGLAARNCVPCKGGVPPLKGKEIQPLIGQLEGWAVMDEHHLTKTYKFPNFAEALKFVDQVGEIAEREWHHPDIYLAWGKVRVDIWTHKIDGLTESDFILAAKLDQAYSARS